ncbi:MAG: Rrf2 family transcriptional regulator [Comamonadaceae bacterium]|nr:MAG: Rrf2 family transcriptional regulator [Comamonadaceae bacterium]
MRLTTKGRFAVAAMIDVALHSREKPVNLGTISVRQEVSLSYLEQLFTRLRQHGLVKSTRGPGGGYSLGRNAARITVADIIFAVDDPVSEQEAAPQGTTARITTPDLWASLGRQMVDYLDSVNLQSLVAEQLARGVLTHEARPVKPLPSIQRAKPVLPQVPNSVFALGKVFAPR